MQQPHRCSCFRSRPDTSTPPLPKTPFQLPLNWPVEPRHCLIIGRHCLQNMLPWLLTMDMSRDLLQPMTTCITLFNLSPLTSTGHRLVKRKLELNVPFTIPLCYIKAVIIQYFSLLH